MAALDGMRSAWVSEIAQRTTHFPDPEEESAFAAMHSAPLRLSREQARELFAAVEQKIEAYFVLNRDRSGADLPGDPDIDGGALDVQMLFTMVSERPQSGEPGADGGGSSR